VRALENFIDNNFLTSITSSSLQQHLVANSNYSEEKAAVAKSQQSWN